MNSRMPVRRQSQTRRTLPLALARRCHSRRDGDAGLGPAVHQPARHQYGPGARRRQHGCQPGGNPNQLRPSGRCSCSAWRRPERLQRADALGGVQHVPRQRPHLLGPRQRRQHPLVRRPRPRRGERQCGYTAIKEPGDFSFTLNVSGGVLELVDPEAGLLPLDATVYLEARISHGTSLLRDAVATARLHGNGGTFANETFDIDASGFDFDPDTFFVLEDDGGGNVVGVKTELPKMKNSDRPRRDYRRHVARHQHPALRRRRRARGRDRGASLPARPGACRRPRPARRWLVDQHHDRHCRPGHRGAGTVRLGAARRRPARARLPPPKGCTPTTAPIMLRLT